MTVPIEAPIFDEPMDPKDVRPWDIIITRAGGSDPYPMLEAGEEVASYTLGPSIEGIAAGLSVKSGGGYDPVLADDTVTFYPAVDVGSQNASMFNDPGQVLGIELTIVKNTTPAETIQRTVGLRVRQR